MLPQCETPAGVRAGLRRAAFPSEGPSILLLFVDFLETVMLAHRVVSWLTA
jgi:hypothetical protein